MSLDSKTRLGDRITIREAFAELSDFEPHPASVRLLPAAFCRRHGVAILSQVGQTASSSRTCRVASPTGHRSTKSDASRVTEGSKRSLTMGSARWHRG